MSASLFLVSTPLHLLVSLAIIGSESRRNNYLCIIDQPTEQPALFEAALTGWGASPFLEVRRFRRAPKSGVAKVNYRKQLFAELKTWIEALDVNEIFVGNDRRIEFQYLMHIQTQLGRDCEGVYMDEGLFTYVGRAASHSFADKWVDQLLKKLSYGLWWQNPPTVGGSAWIKRIYASYPHLVHPLLRTKAKQPLDAGYWSNPLLQAYCQQLLSHVDDLTNLAAIQSLVTLPHESILVKNSAYRTQLENLLNPLLGAGQSVALKQHPRDQHSLNQLLTLTAEVASLPNQIPFEALLPMLNDEIKIIGDFSTTLLTAKIIKPQAQVFSLGSGQNSSAQYQSLYRALGIQPWTGA